MADLIPTPLFVFELANNHGGDVEHGLKIIRAVHQVSQRFPFRFGFKLQYRDLDTFIHPSFRDRKDLKFVRRFSETRLTEKEFLRLVDEMRLLGFTAICTPFDEISVDRLVAHGIDVLKIASCSLTDWPLLERIAKTGKPIIASTAGSSLEDIDRVVSFFEHRGKSLALMHCVADYPTPPGSLCLGQIDLFRSRYPKVMIGFSTHELPSATDPVKLAIAKGAMVFEKHVGLPQEGQALNAYSATPAQVESWLEAAQMAYAMCGSVFERYEPSDDERRSLLDLRRGVFAARPLARGEKLEAHDEVLAIPVQEGQLTANDLSKYVDFYLEEDLEEGAPVYFSQLKKVDNQQRIYDIVARVRELIRRSGVVVPPQVDLEISHHYGLGRFDEFGLTMITVVNREYCKKLIMLLADQRHPEQHHKVKEETFHVLFGEIELALNGETKVCRAGDVVTVERGVRHSFGTQAGAIIEEISSTHRADDSWYTDPEIAKNKHRKTLLTYWIT